MKRLEDTEQPTAPKTEEELYGLLIRYYGRVLRVRTISEVYVDGRGVRRASVSVFDRVGVLSAPHLTITHTGYNGKITSGRFGLEFKLDGESMAIDPKRSSVEVLQADSGEWLLIHRGEELTKAASDLDDGTIFSAYLS